MAKQSIYEANRIAKARAEAQTAKDYFKTALEKKSIESKQARAGRKVIVGVTSSLRRGSGRGVRTIVRLPQASTGWSNLGLIAGTPFKDYRSREVFPSSKADRSLHPQEKAEIDALVQKVRLFGQSPIDVKKKNPEVL